jgi:hypothetical protein
MGWKHRQQPDACTRDAAAWAAAQAEKDGRHADRKYGICQQAALRKAALQVILLAPVREHDVAQRCERWTSSWHRDALHHHALALADGVVQLYQVMIRYTWQLYQVMIRYTWQLPA